MVSIMGYSAWGDVNCFDVAREKSTFDKLMIQENTFSGINLTNNTDEKYLLETPQYDAGYTYVNSKFENFIFAPFLKDDYNNIHKIVISRKSRESDDYSVIKTFELSSESWETINFNVLKEVMIDTVMTTQMLYYKIEYYRWVNGISTLSEDETKYTELEYQLRSNFISDKDECFPFFMKVNVTEDMNQEVATLKPLGKEYPIIIKNSRMNYKSGSFQAMLMTGDVLKDLQTGEGFSLRLRDAMQDYKEKLLKFLTNGKLKCFRLIHGEMFYAHITGNINVSWDRYGTGYCCNIRFNWTEASNNDMNFYN